MIVTRFAPSPTGRLHLGHAFSAVARPCRSDAKAAGKFLLRIEDLDQGRSRPEFVDGILRGSALARPRVGRAGAGPVAADATPMPTRSTRFASRGWSTPASARAPTSPQSLTAPHGDAATSYPGTCRRLARRPGSPRDDPALLAAGFRQRRWTVAGCRRGRRPMASASTGSEDQIGDAILARKDAPASYHLCLRRRRCRERRDHWSFAAPTSGPRRRSSGLLQVLLGLPEPTYLHHPLVTHEDGRRLAKRDLAPTLAAMREAGVDGRRPRSRPASRQASRLVSPSATPRSHS